MSSRPKTTVPPQIPCLNKLLVLIYIIAMKSSRVTYSAEELAMYGISNARYRKRRRFRINKTLPITAGCVVMGFGIGVTGSIYVKSEFDLIKPEVRVETGSFVSKDVFFTGELDKANVLTDLSKIDTSVPGTYQVTISLYGKKVNSVLEVSDTTPPVGTAIPQRVLEGHAPNVNETVSDLYDLSGTVYVDYSGTPDTRKAGDKMVPVALTDAYGNVSVVEVPFTVFADTTPPVIEGCKNITVIAGDPIKLMDGITVSDDYSSNLAVDVEASQLDTTTPGKYDVFYYSTDEAGNTATVPVTVTVKKRPNNYVYPEEVYKIAQPIYDEIIDRDDYTDVEKAMRIFKWANEAITYVDTSDKSHWTGAAVQGFTTLHGDCYNYYACTKALLDIAGIENEYVYGSGKWWHCWNLVKLEGKWYHCDACRTRTHSSYWFMRTDAELDSKFPLKSTGLPERATKSVQNRLDFTILTIYP